MSIEKKFKYTPLPEPILITQQEWPEDTLPLVHTRHMTFNHENFIRDCIEGVLMQKTTFPVQVLIHDDASTDKTAEIVQEYESKYPKLIKGYYQKENTYRKPDKHERRKAFTDWRIGKYEAPCEGDDYWTDPLKLQKQVDYMESHPDYVACFHDFEVLKDETGKFEKRAKSKLLINEKAGFSVSSYWDSNTWITQPLAALYSTEAYNSIKFPKYKFQRDVHVFYHLLQKGKGYWMNEVMGIYRHHSGGIFSMKNHDQNLDTSYFIYKEIAFQNRGDKKAVNYFSAMSAGKIVSNFKKQYNSSVKSSQILKDNISISFAVFFKTLLRVLYYSIKT